MISAAGVPMSGSFTSPAEVSRELPKQKIAGPLWGQTGKHLLDLSLSGFDPCQHRIVWQGCKC
jgi:hypothetical protein